MSERAIIPIIVAFVSIGIVGIPSYFCFIVSVSIQEQTNQNQNVIVTTNNVDVETTNTNEIETINTANTEVANINNQETITASGGTPNNAESNSDISRM